MGAWLTEVWTCESAGLTKHFSNVCCGSKMRRGRSNPVGPTMKNVNLLAFFYGCWPPAVWACEPAGLAEVFLWAMVVTSLAPTLIINSMYPSQKTKLVTRQ